MAGQYIVIAQVWKYTPYVIRYRYLNRQTHYLPLLHYDFNKKNTDVLLKYFVGFYGGYRSRQCIYIPRVSILLANLVEVLRVQPLIGYGHLCFPFLDWAWRDARVCLAVLTSQTVLAGNAGPGE